MNQPTIANRYEIQGLIDQGGMGRVFHGLDHKTGLPVAIKQLIDEHVPNNPEIIERFQREGVLLKQLDHPNIVRILSSLDIDGSYFIVMEYVGGGSLKTLLEKQSPLPIQHTLEIALDLADALARTHRLGIIHRDIKPANVLLAEDGTPRLSDFGIARSVNRTHTQQLTTTGAIIGTYAYLSPEACHGEVLDHRADIWSFGVMLYEMLSGQRPFQGESEVAVLINIMQREPENILSIRPEIPTSLAKLVEQMLVKDREQRIDSIRYVGAQIESLLRATNKGDVAQSSRFDTPSSNEVMITLASDTAPPNNTAPTHTPAAQPEASQPTSSAQHKPGRWLTMATAVIVMLLVGGIAFLMQSSSDRNQQNDTNDSNAAVAIVNNEPADAQRVTILVTALEPIDTTRTDPSRFIVSDLQQKLTASSSLIEIDILPYPQIVRSQKQAADVAAANQAEIILWGNYDDTISEVNLQYGNITDYELYIDQEFIKELGELQIWLRDPRNESVIVPVLSALSWFHGATGDGLAFASTLAQLRRLDYTNAEYVNNGTAANDMLLATETYIDDLDQSLLHIEKALEKAPGNPLLFAALGILRLRQGQPTEAALMLDTAERLLGNQSWPFVAFQRANIALATQDYETALSHYVSLVEQRPNDWFVVNFTGFLHYMLGNYEQARADYERAFALNPTSNFPYPISVMLALRDADIAEATRLIDEMLVTYPDPLAAYYITLASLGAEVNIVVSPYFAAFGNQVLARYDESIYFAEQALAIDSNLPGAHLMIGFAECNLGNLAAAEAAFSRVIELDSAFYSAYLMRADVRFRSGDTEAAMADFAIGQNAIDPENPNAAYVEWMLAGELTCENILQP